MHGSFSTSSHLHFFITGAIGLHSISAGTLNMSSGSNLTIRCFFAKTQQLYGHCPPQYLPLYWPFGFLYWCEKVAHELEPAVV